MLRQITPASKYMQEKRGRANVFTEAWACQTMSMQSKNLKVHWTILDPWTEYSANHHCKAESLDIPMKNAWIYDIYLVGGIPTPVNKNEFVTWDDYIPIYMEKIKKKKFQTINQLQICTICNDTLKCHVARYCSKSLCFWGKNLEYITYTYIFIYITYIYISWW